LQITQKILKLVSQVADSETTILIQGESGTGKELVAHSLHNNSSQKDKPFVAINCGALTENLLESELFGHVKGAFTGAINDKLGWFEKAHEGTIFLDELAEMSQSLQVKLLRLLQSGEYSKVGSTQVSFCEVRVIAATNKNLRKLVEKGKFREDLYYRINVITIDLPPLRERKNDIPLLVQHFLKKFNLSTNKNIKSLSQDAERILSNYDFPGNVRELENIIHRAVVLTEDQTIGPGHFPANIIPNFIASQKDEKPVPFKIAKQRTMEKFEKEYLINCLGETKGNISRAAKKAGIHFKNFYAKIEKYGISASDYKQ